MTDKLIEPTSLPPQTLPPTTDSLGWKAVVGCIVGCVAVLFLMFIVFAGMFGHPIPAETPFPFHLLAAFLTALSFAFISGEASVRTSLHIQNFSPIAVQAGGGIAVFFITLIMCTYRSESLLL
jgi:hypothetical protein